MFKHLNVQLKYRVLYACWVFVAAFFLGGASPTKAEDQKRQVTITRTVEQTSSNGPEKDEEVQTPPDLVEATKLNEQVQKSVGLPADEKEQLAGEFASIQASFHELWKPLKDAEAGYKEKKAEWNALFEDRRRAFLQPPKTFVLPDQQAAVDAEKQAITDWNAENEELTKKAEAELKERAIPLLFQRAALDLWVQSNVQQFNTKAKTTLLQFKEGLAYKQLKAAAAAHGDTGVVIENSGAATPVDARGAGILLPSERQRLQQLPGAQLPRGFRITPNAPPPPNK